MTLTADLEEFVRDHCLHGTLTGDATEPAWNGYMVTAACSCGLIFERWVTSQADTIQRREVPGPRVPHAASESTYVRRTGVNPTHVAAGPLRRPHPSVRRGSPAERRLSRRGRPENRPLWRRPGLATLLL